MKLLRLRCTVPTVSEEAARPVRERWFECSLAALRDGKRVDCRGDRSMAEQLAREHVAAGVEVGIEHLPRRDGIVIEPLKHHRRFSFRRRLRSQFVRLPRLLPDRERD